MSAFSPPYPAGLPIGDGWVETEWSSTVVFPFDGSAVCDAPVGNVPKARAALDAAVAVAPQVAGLPARVRREVLLSGREALGSRRAEMEHLLALETGKPLVDCRVEVERALVTLAAAAEEAGRIKGETVPLDLLAGGEGLVGFWTRRPIGVVGAITGFNYPLLLSTHKIAPAVAAGCPVICKPAPQTPLATLWLVHVLREAAVACGAPPALHTLE